MWIDLLDVLKMTDVEGVLGCEYATAKHSLSSSPPSPLVLFNVSHVRICNSSTLETIPVEWDDYNFCIGITDKLSITNPERTICDMIRFDRDERFLYESLDKYTRRNPDLSELFIVADHYAVRSELESHLEGLSEWLIDFYEH